MSTILKTTSLTPGRTQLSQDDIEVCSRYATEHFPDHALEPVAQGGCSYTLKAKSDDDNGCQVIAQFRLPRYTLSLELAATAYRLYAMLAPETQALEDVKIDDGTTLQVLSMSCIPGERFSDVQPRTPALNSLDLFRMQRAVRSFSLFFAKQWFGGERHIPALSGCTGRVGSTFLTRLRELERRLPGARLRKRAGRIRHEVQDGVLDRLPVVLTHGDLLPSNIMIDAASFEIKGYVDWAEAEYLPFGISLYGLEHLLGYLDNDSGTKKPIFTYYTDAEELRTLFWRSLAHHVHELGSDAVRHAIETSAQIGILLWHGFAWDSGKIDRVVDLEHDSVEFEYLQKFLGVQAEPMRRDSTMFDASA